MAGNAGLSISQLTAGTSVNAGDLIPAVQGSTGPGTGSNVKLTLAQILAGAGGIIPLSTVTALRALTTVPAPVLWVEGYHAPLDYGEGMFVYVAADTTSADNGGTIIVAAGGQRWYREIQSLPYSVCWFGATGDGTTNDTAAIQACFTAAADQEVYVPVGNYLVDTLTVPAPLKITGAGVGGAQFLARTATTVILSISGSQVLIQSLAMVASGTHTGGAFVQCSGTEVTLENCSFIGGLNGFQGLTGAASVVLRDCTMRGFTGTGISMVAVTQFSLEGNRIGPSTGTGIATSGVCNEYIILGNRCSGNTTGISDLASGASKVVVNNLT